MQNLENLAYICKIIARLFSMSKHTVVTTNGKRGGNLVGKPHKNKQRQDVGGIKAVVTDANNRPVELEGGEVIINKEASKKHWKELSRINQSAGNGVPINKPIDPHDEDPEEYAKGGKIEFNPNQLPNKWILNYAKNIKKNHPEIWKKGGNIYGNQAFENLLRVSERGYWLDSEEWFYVKWRSFVARHKGDFRIAGVVAMLKWVDKIDRGWQYMKNLIEDEIKKIEAKKDTKEKGGWSVSKDQRMSRGGDLEASREKNSFVTYRLKNQKGKGYNGLYKKLFTLLNKDSIFSECYEEYSYYDGNDMIVTCSWGLEGELPKGITEVDKFNEGGNNPDIRFDRGGQTERQQAKIGYTMREFKEGNLKTSYGEKVTDEKQAIAIALSKAGVDKKQYGGEIEVGLKGFYKGKKRVPITVTKTNAKNIYFRNEETGEIKRSERKNFEKLFQSGMGVTNSSSTDAIPIIYDTPMPIIDDTPSPKKDGKGSKIPSTDKTQVNYYELFRSKNEVIEMSNNETMALQLGRFVKMADEDRLMRMEDIQDFKKAIDKLG